MAPQLTPQMADVDIDRSIERRCLTVARHSHELVAGHHSSNLSDQVFQDVVLNGCQAHNASINAD
jgi:hypothetical protein